MFKAETMRERLPTGTFLNKKILLVKVPILPPSILTFAFATPKFPQTT